MCSIANICKTQPRSACRFHHSFLSSIMGRSSYKKPKWLSIVSQSEWMEIQQMSNSARLDNESSHCQSLQDKAQSCRTWSKAGDQSGWMKCFSELALPWYNDRNSRKHKLRMMTQLENFNARVQWEFYSKLNQVKDKHTAKNTHHTTCLCNSQKGTTSTSVCTSVSVELQSWIKGGEKKKQEVERCEVTSHQNQHDGISLLFKLVQPLLCQ